MLGYRGRTITPQKINQPAIASPSKVKAMRSSHYSPLQSAISVAIGRCEVILLKCVTKNIFIHTIYVCKLNGIQKKPRLIFKSMAYGFLMPKRFCMIPMRFLLKTRQPKVSKDLSQLEWIISGAYWLLFTQIAAIAFD